MKVRRKPLVYDAHQYDPKGFLPMWAVFAAKYKKDQLYIKTLEGMVRVSANDWLLKGSLGEVWPVHPDVFKASYEPVEDGK